MAQRSGLTTGQGISLLILICAALCEAISNEDLWEFDKRTWSINRFNLQPAKRSIATGRFNLRPGKRTIAVGRFNLRPGKRAGELAGPCDPSVLDPAAMRMQSLLEELEELSMFIKQCAPPGMF